MTQKQKRFSVKLDGQVVDVHQARVSAFPMNQVWNGKQRNIDQTEIAYFVTFDFADIVELEIELIAEGISTLEIRPSKFEINNTVKDNVIKLKLTEAKHFTVEVNGSHHALHVFSNRELSYQKQEEDIYFGKGEHFPGLICPKSNQTIYIAEEATVYGAIFINRADNVKIIGRGILDSSRLKRGIEAVSGEEGGEAAQKLHELGFSDLDIQYSGAVVAYACNDLSISGIIIKDSMFWTLIVRNNCSNVLIENVKIIGQWRYNSDGINICCSENVIIKNCFIRSYDDCFVVRGAYLGDAGNTTNVLVENCVMWCDWGISLEIWTGDKSTRIEGISFENNYLIHLSHTAIDIMTWYGSDNTYIGNIKYKNIFIDSDDFYPASVFQKDDIDKYECGTESQEPLLMKISCAKLGKNAGNQKHIPSQDLSVYNLHYENIIAENVYCTNSEKKFRTEIKGMEGVLSISDLRLKNIASNDFSITGNVQGITID